MLYKDCIIRFIQTSTLDEHSRRWGNIVNGVSYVNEENAVKHPWIALVDRLSVYHSDLYRPGVVWSAYFCVGADTPKLALDLAKFLL